MNYKELIRLVHPDLNPNVVDAGVKISQIMSNKNNPHELLRLAINWGLVNSNDSYSNPKPKYTNTDWVIFSYINKRQFTPGMKVRFTSSNGNQEAWFVKSGKNKTFFTNKKGVFTVNSSLNDLFNKFEIFRFRSNDLSYSELTEWKEIIKNLKVKSPAKSNETFNDLFIKLNLKPHSVYSNVYVMYRDRYYRLIKTNERCAFIDYNGEEKRILLKTITKVKEI